MKIILTLVSFLLLYFKASLPVLATFNSTATYHSLSFSIAEQNPPQSEIEELPFQVTNQNSVPITVKALDDSGVQKIFLYYSFNFGPWILFDEAQSDQYQFNFSAPQGDGLYSFRSLAVDIYNHLEDKEEDFFNSQLKFDTTAPTSNLIIFPATHSSLSATLDNNNPLFVQDIFIPQSVSAHLDFVFRFRSQDIAEYNFFDVYLTDSSGENILEKILTYGNLDSSNLDHDSGWLHLSRNLSHLAGKFFKLIFRLTDLNHDSDTTSVLEIADLQTHLLDSRLPLNPDLNLLVTDLGSEIIDYPTLSPLEVGENIVSVSATDSAGNSELPQHYPIVVLPDLVINRVDKYAFTLFNNSLTQVLDLSNLTYSLNNSSPLTIDSTQLSPLQSLTVFFPSTQTTANLKLFQDDNLVTSFQADDLDNFYWQRQFSGLGPWLKIASLPTVNLESRLSVSKITLTVSGLATTLADMSYTIDYQDAAGDQQIFGQILPEQIDEQGFVSRDFFLGTCSSGGTCVPASGLSKKFMVTFSNLAPQEFNFE